MTAQGLPVVEFDWSADDNGVDQGWTERRADAILKAAGLASSLGDARRKIAENGAVKINDEVISDSSRWFRACLSPR